MEIPFLNCNVKVWSENGYIETIFDDGAKCPAMPNYNSYALFTAKELGYGDNCKRMTVDHEILHTFLCEQCGFPYSPTLWAVAHDFREGTIPICYQQQEEAFVLSFQKYLNDAGFDPILIDFDKSNKQNLKTRKLKGQALKILDFRI